MWVIYGFLGESNHSPLQIPKPSFWHCKMKSDEVKNRVMTIRLHGLLLVAHGKTCPEVAALLGDAPRTVEYWIRGFEERGLAALREGDRSGRPGRLSAKHLRGINAALRRMPREMGLGGNVWDGKTLAAWIKRQYGIALGVRQCQRLFRRLGFRLRKPRPALAQADPERQKAHKKNSKR